MDHNWDCPFVAEGLVFGEELQLFCRRILWIGWIEDKYPPIWVPFKQLILREGPGATAASRFDKKVESNVTATTSCVGA
jgi:hypothetical protein